MRNKILVFAVMAVIMLIVGCAKSPDPEQIKTDLIGQTMGAGFDGWKFESLGEFQEIAIKNKNQQGDIIEYDISMRLKNSRGQEYLAEVLVVYKKVDGSWKIASISQKQFKKVL